MFRREYSGFCAACGAVTWHADHRLARALAFGLGALGVAAGAALLALQRWGWLALLGYASAWIVLERRERHVELACTRCRDRALAARRATRPDPRNSTIDI